jgi:hypothetical protein
LISYTTFLDSDYLSRLFVEVTAGNGVDKIKIGLIYTILAAGCQVHWGQEPQCDISKGKIGAAALFSKALECSEAVSEAASPTAFQVSFRHKVSFPLLKSGAQALLSMVRTITASNCVSALSYNFSLFLQCNGRQTKPADF